MNFHPSSSQFKSLKGNLKPCWTTREIPKKDSQEFLFDLFQKYQDRDSVFLYSGKTGRYSFFAKNPFQTFTYKNDQCYISDKLIKSEPIAALRKLFNQFKSPKIKDLPPFYCGAIGLFGYETFTLFENIPKAKKNDLKIPEIVVNFYDEILIFDHLKSKLFIVGCAKKYAEAKRKVARMLNDLKKIPLKKGEASLQDAGGGKQINSSTYNKADIFKVQVRDIEPAFQGREAINHISTNDQHFTSNFTPEKYYQVIEKVKKYLIEGDTFQVNISQRLEGKLKTPPAEIFKIIMGINPSPFSAFFNGGNFQIVSCSPERLVRKKETELFTQPIAGTRKRGRTQKEDNELAHELKNSPKEMAEHTMLVDLERNDLGKISNYGSVITKSFAHIEKYSHVQHLVSNVYGKIKQGKDFFDVLKAVFPGGTITGAPKIRTMEIISELEPTQRGPYTGSIGYIGFNGNFDLNILIRTIVCTNKKMYIQVGGGIVTDSIAEKEYRETLHKAKAMLEAVS